MSKIKLYIVLLLIITLTASIIILPACTEEAAPAEEVAEEVAAPWEGEKIGYISMDSKLSYFQSQHLALGRIAESEGFEEIILDPAFDSQKYIDQVDTLITQKVVGILLSVWEPGLGATAVQKVQDEGIPIVVLHVPAADTVEVPTVVADNYKAGVLAGEEAAKMWQAENPDRDPVIGIITNTDAPENVKRTSGMTDAFQEVYPDAPVAGTLDGGYDLETSLAACEDLLTANPDVNVIFTSHDTQALGALAGLKGTGRGTWPDAIVCSVDASRQSSDEIKNPVSAFKISIGNSPVTSIETAWEEVMKPFLLGEEYPMFTMHDMELIVVDNIDEYLDINFPIVEE